MDHEILLKHAAVLEALKFYGVGLENLEDGRNLKEIEKKQVSFSIIPTKREQANKYYSVIKEKQHVVDYLIKASKVGVDKVGNVKVEKSEPKSPSTFEKEKDSIEPKKYYRTENDDAEIFRRELRNTLDSIKIDENNEIVKRGQPQTNKKQSSFDNKDRQKEQSTTNAKQSSFNNEYRQKEQFNNRPNYHNSKNNSTETGLVVWFSSMIGISLLLVFLGVFNYQEGSDMLGLLFIIAILSTILTFIAVENGKGRK